MQPLSRGVTNERKVIRELLLSYKQHPYLWNTTHELYGNSEAKKQAFTALLKIYRLLVTDANIDTLKKKIDNLRTSYKRERKKVLNNPKHIPSLWYYRYLKFLHEGITIASHNSENEIENEDEDEIEDESSEDGNNSSSQLRHLLTTDIGSNITSQICHVVVSDEVGEGESSSSQICHITDPDLKLDSYTPEESTYTIKTDVSSETDAFGRALGLQLSELSPMQKTIAEKLISEVIFYGRLDKLTTKTTLINLNDDFLEL